MSLPAPLVAYTTHHFLLTNRTGTPDLKRFMPKAQDTIALLRNTIPLADLRISKLDRHSRKSDANDQR